jgi:prostaglandin-E synthase
MAALAANNTAPIKWAQRSDNLYLTIAVPDVKDETITLTDNKLIFKGKSGEKVYEVDIEFYKPCVGEESTYKVMPRSIQMLIMKKKAEGEEEEDFWPRLLKDKSKEKNQVNVDWDRYVDQDEEDEAGDFDASGLEGGQNMGGGNGDPRDPRNQQQGGGMPGGMGG